MGDLSERPGQKVEETINGFVASFTAYARTFLTLLYPACFPRHLFVRLGQLKRRNLLAPPLLFLSISAFMFSLVIGLIDSDRFSLDVREWLSWFKENARLDTSLIEIVFTILPIFFWALFVGWVTKYLANGNSKRRRAVSYFYYAFGIFAAGFFVWFLANSIVMLSYTQNSAFWMRHRSLDNFRMLVSVVSLMWILFQPFGLIVSTMWRLNRSRALAKRIAASIAAVLLMAMVISGSVVIQGLPKRFDAAIAKAPERLSPRFVYWRDESVPVADIRSEKPDAFILRLRVVANNPGSTALFVDQNQYLEVYSQNPSVYQAYWATIKDLSEPNSSLIVLKPQETKVFDCYARISKEQYQAVEGMSLTFDLKLSWYEVRENAVRKQQTSVLDEGHRVLQFPKPQPTPAS